MIVLQGEKVLELTNLTKTYPGVVALSDVSLDLKQSEVHGIVGENGAGKSTLIKIATGAIQPDSGSIRLGGQTLAHNTPAGALDAGVSAVYQEFSLFPELSVAENLFFGREPRSGPFIRRNLMRRESTRLLEMVGADVNPDAVVKQLSVGQQQLVEIAKALSRNAKVVIMDEPTAPLTSHEVQKLYETVRLLITRGVSIFYISHRFDEIFTLCDRVSVMRDGQLVATLAAGDATRSDLIQLMVGRPLSEEFPVRKGAVGPVKLSVRNLAGGKVSDVSFDVKRGEIFGLGGLIGAGRTETARLLFGADKATSGSVALDGRPVTIRTPNDAIKAGFGLIPEDRKRQGALLDQSLRFNVVFASLGKISRFGFIDARAEGRVVEEYRKALRIRTPHVDQLVRNLSGGNQQKVVLSKWLLNKPEVLIFDEPTRGIDVGAKHEIYELIHRLAEEGLAIILISSEMPELLGLSDRIGVLHEGRLTGILDKDEFSQERIMQLAFGYQAS